VRSCTQRLTGRLGAPVLPDDRVVDRLTGLAVPDHRRLALVGDAQRGNVLRRDTGRGQGLARGGELALPDLDGVVLHPAGMGVQLPGLALRHGDDAPFGIEHDAA
jgi:hypothetical protein